MKVEDASTLVVVDMQNDFITGSLGSKEAKAIVPNVCGLIRSFVGGVSRRVVLTLDTHGFDYKWMLEGRKLPVEHCVKGTPGWCLHPDVVAEARRGVEGTVILKEKHTFGCAELRDLWPGNGFVVCGLCTDICVVSNALALRMFFPNTEIAVVANACAGTTPEAHEAALKVMESNQIEVIR